jgi:endonuclease/exonuclease/phosphatase (EEP) superfamily protein YafD
VRPAWPPARKVVGALAVALAAASVLPAIDTNLWWIRIFSYPRVQFFWMLPGVVVASLLLPDRFRWSGIASSAIAAAALAYQASVLTPWSPLHTPQVVAIEACPGEGRMRVLTVNVEMSNERSDELFEQIREADPDVVLVQEVDR